MPTHGVSAASLTSRRVSRGSRLSRVPSLTGAPRPSVVTEADGVELPTATRIPTAEDDADLESGTTFGNWPRWHAAVHNPISPAEDADLSNPYRTWNPYDIWWLEFSELSAFDMGGAPWSRFWIPSPQEMPRVRKPSSENGPNDPPWRPVGT